MSPLPPAAERPLWALGARRARPTTPTARELVGRLREAAAASEPLVALMDARGVAGERHLLSAWAHLGRARSRGESRLRDRGAEFLLYVAGDDQLPRALAKVGVGADTEEFVLAGEPPREPAALLEKLGLVAADGIYPRPVDAELLDRLGIQKEDRSIVPEASWEGLVLERIALLELSQPRTGSGSPEPPRK
ncbi:MAG: hypothetical protein L3J93_00680 [Thermoplasmata archaeon]|nr:hypothetical protein [Thermoplasmata archaeon]